MRPTGLILVAAIHCGMACPVLTAEDVMASVTLEGHTGRIAALTFSPDGKLLASASDDYTVGVWDTVKGESITTLEGHDFSVTDVRFSPNGAILASSSIDKSIRVWSPRTGAVTTPFPKATATPYRLAFSPDGKVLGVVGFEET